MKRFLCLFLGCLVLCTAALAESTYHAIMMVDHCEEWVSLREGPGTKYKRLAKVPLFALVTDAEWKKGYGEFTRCEYNGKTGYILTKYLEPWQDPEPGGEERYTTGRGFSFYYDSALLEVEEGMTEEGEGLMVSIRDESPDYAVYLEFLSSERLGMTPREFLNQNLPAGQYPREEDMQYGGILLWTQKPYAYNPALTDTYCVAESGGHAVAAYCTWPASVNAKWFEPFMEIMRSISFAEDIPVRVEEGAAAGVKKALVLDKDGEYITIAAQQTVTETALLSLELGGDGNFTGSVFREVGTITPDSPLVVKMAFPGDFPSWGIRFTDEKGAVRQFAISVSGRDGTLQLEDITP